VEVSAHVPDTEDLWLAGLDAFPLATVLPEPHWGVWKSIPNGSSKPDKKPTPNRNEAWWSFDKAQAKVNNGGGYAGMGFNVLDAGRSAIDLDNCRDKDTGEIDGRAQVLVDDCGGAYVEVSPSGKGLKILGARNANPRFLQVDFHKVGDGSPAAVGLINNYFAVTFKGQGNPDTDISGVIDAWALKIPKSESGHYEPTTNPDSRHIECFKMLRSWKAKGLSFDAALVETLKHNAAFDQPLPERDLRPYLERSWNEPDREKPNKKAEAPRRTLIVDSAALIKPASVPWLWDLRLPLGMLSLLAGREGLGKSAIAYERAARITRGQLEGDLKGQPRGVIVAATEDSWEHVIVPRLMAAGADLNRVFRVRVAVQDLGNLELSLPDDIPALRSVIGEHDVSLVLLDPIISRLGRRLDTHKDSDVRQALEPIVGLAHETGASVLGVIHLNKTATSDPLNAVMGSRAFGATARAVMLVVRDDEGNRFLCFPKNNLAAEQKSRAFSIKSRDLDEKDEKGKPITTAEIVWGEESDVTARDVMAESAMGRPRTTSDKAAEWLRERLKGGPVPVETLEEEAKVIGIPWRTVQRARKELQVLIEGAGFPKRNTWSLPSVEV
jgi:hypothetical protein